MRRLNVINDASPQNEDGTLTNRLRRTVSCNDMLLFKQELAERTEGEQRRAKSERLEGRNWGWT